MQSCCNCGRSGNLQNAMVIDSDGRIFCSEECGQTFSFLFIPIQQERQKSDRTYVISIDKQEKNEKFIRGPRISQRLLQLMHRRHYLVARYTHAGYSKLIRSSKDLYFLHIPRLQPKISAEKIPPLIAILVFLCFNSHNLSFRAKLN